MNINTQALAKLSDKELAELLWQVRNVSGLPYIATEKQLQFHNHPARGGSEPVLYGGSMGGGKSAALCAEAIRECLEVPGNKVLLARKELVVFKRTTLVELQKLLEVIPYEVTHRISEQKFLFPNGSELHYAGLGTDKDREKLKGLEIGMLGIDEASEITRETYQMAAARLRHKPAASAERLKSRLTSNPEPGWLKEDFIDNPVPLRDKETGEVRRDSQDRPIIAYHYIPATVKDNPHVPPDYIYDLKQMFADNPNWAKAYLEGNWDAFSGADQAIPSHMVADAIIRKTDAGWPVIWGLDVARMGNDSTVLVQRAGYKFTILHKWTKQRLDLTGDDVIALYKNATIKPRSINVDDIGVGGGMVDYLRKYNLPVVGVNVGKSSRYPERYYNTKAEMWWNLRRLFESGLVDLPSDPELKTELTSTRYEFVPSTQKIRIEDKEIVKKKLGRSPDEADALALASWEGIESYVLYDSPVDPMKETVELTDLKRRESIGKLLKVLKNAS